MPYTEAELVQFVAAKIDEILPPGEDVETDSLIEAPIPFIQRELKESGYHILRQAPITQVKQVLKKADFHFATGQDNTPDPNPAIRIFEGDTDDVYIVPCPTDFLRFLNIKLSTWMVSVSEIMREEEPNYRAQKTIKWTRGTELKPKAAIISFTDYTAGEIVEGIPNINKAIECFSSRTLPTLSYLHYVPKVAPDNMPDDLVEAMVWECAGRTLLIMNQADRAAIAFAQVPKYYANKYGLTGE